MDVKKYNRKTSKALRNTTPYTQSIAALRTAQRVWPLIASDSSFPENWNDHASVYLATVEAALNLGLCGLIDKDFRKSAKPLASRVCAFTNRAAVLADPKVATVSRFSEPAYAVITTTTLAIESIFLFSGNREELNAKNQFALKAISTAASAIKNDGILLKKFLKALEDDLSQLKASNHIQILEAKIWRWGPPEEMKDAADLFYLTAATIGHADEFARRYRSWINSGVNWRNSGDLVEAWSDSFFGVGEFPAIRSALAGIRERKKAGETFRPPRPNAQRDTAAELDLMGMTPHVEALASVLENRETELPLNVSIEGNWGVGKTSFMRQLKKRLNEGRINEERIRKSRRGEKRRKKRANLKRRIAKRRPNKAENAKKKRGKSVRLSKERRKEERLKKKVRKKELIELRRLAKKRRKEERRKKKRLKKDSNDSIWKQRRPIPCVCAWFNPWRHRSGESVWAAIALEVTDQLKERLPWFKKYLLGIRMLWKRSRLRLVSTLIITLLVFFIVAWYFALKIKNGNGGGEQSEQSRIVEAIRGDFLLILIWTLIYSPPLNFFHILYMISTQIRKSGIASVVLTPDYSGKIDFVAKFHEDFSKIIDNFARGCRLVLFIDDLDRCDVDSTNEVLRAVNVLISHGHKERDESLIFVLALNRINVAVALGRRSVDIIKYLNPGLTEGADFERCVRDHGIESMGKFIQLAIRVPRPGDRDIPVITRNFLPTVSDETDGGDGINYKTESEDATSKHSMPGPLPSNIPSLEAVQARMEEIRPRIYSIEKVTELVTGDSSDIREMLEMASMALEHNPRRWRQFLNIVRYRAFLYTRMGVFCESVEHVNPDDSALLMTLPRLSKLAAMELRHPLLADYLETNPKFLTRFFEKEELRRQWADEPFEVGIWLKDRQLRNLFEFQQQNANYDLRNIDYETFVKIFVPSPVENS